LSRWEAPSDARSHVFEVRRNGTILAGLRLQRGIYAEVLDTAESRSAAVMKEQIKAIDFVISP